jgi:hypothetical protein
VGTITIILLYAGELTVGAGGLRSADGGRS